MFSVWLTDFIMTLNIVSIWLRFFLLFVVFIVIYGIFPIRILLVVSYLRMLPISLCLLMAVVLFVFISIGNNMKAQLRDLVLDWSLRYRAVSSRTPIDNNRLLELEDNAIPLLLAVADDIRVSRNAARSAARSRKYNSM